MNWRKLESSDETNGMFALIKGQNRESGFTFYGLGTIKEKNGKRYLVSALTSKPFNHNTCDYWYINIAEIK